MEIKPIITMISPELMKSFTDKHGEDLFMRAVNLAEEYRKRWAMDIYGPFEHSSSNMLFAGKSEKYGPIVLKIQMSDDLDKEVSVLRSFEGDYTCPVYEYSPDDRVCLLRRIWPGYTMFFETTREQRAVKLLSGKLGIPAEILFKCLYAETVIWLSREELARGKPPSDYGNLICNMLVAESFVDALKV